MTEAVRRVKCTTCLNPKVPEIHADRAAGMTMVALGKKYDIPFYTLKGHFNSGHSGVQKTQADRFLPASKKQDKEGVRIQWDKKGDGTLSVFGRVTPPSIEELRALLAHSCENPDDFEIIPVDISWAVRWERDEVVASKPAPHTAFTAPSPVLKWKVVRKSTLQQSAPITLIQAAPVNISIRATNRLPKRVTTNLEAAFIFGDLQCGYWQDRHEVWRTFHDERAVDVSHQVLQAAEALFGIDQQVDVGDAEDLPMFSTHPSAPRSTIVGAFNKTNQRLHEILATRSALAPNSKNTMVQGNHPQRLRDWLAKNDPHFLGLQQAGTPEDTPPVLSLEFLQNYALAGWHSSGRAYPNDILWLNHNTKVIHGTEGNAKAGTTLAKLHDEQMNVIQGHSPHFGYSTRAIPTPNGVRTYTQLIVPGLMRNDGKVPSFKSKSNDWGEPSISDGMPWDQGVAIVFYDPEGHAPLQVEPIQIYGGKAVWRGDIFEAQCDVDGNR